MNSGIRKARIQIPQQGLGPITPPLLRAHPSEPDLPNGDKSQSQGCDEG